MDLVADCRLKLEKFPIKELKDLLSLLGLAKNGSKRVLVARIANLLTSEQVICCSYYLTFSSTSRSASSEIARTEEVAKIIHDVHRNMVAEMYETALAGQTRCPCGSPSPDARMVECKNPDCRVLQHKVCVRGLHAVPPHFNCEVCRLNRADLFWVGTKNFLHPTRLELSETRVDRTNRAVNLNTEFHIQGRDLDPTDCESFEVQVWCILLNDAAHFRMHWPKHSQLEVNGKMIEAVDREGDQLLGTNSRDSGALILRYLKEGSNKISFSAEEHRIFCLGVRLVKPRTFKEICEILLKEQDGEPLNVAKARVIRCIRGGTASHDNADRDLEVLSELTVDLRCPISGARMKTASRFKPCVHMACFDLESFFGHRQTAMESQCPICLKKYPWEDIIIDPYFNQVISTIEQSGADTTEIKIRSDGSWFAHHGPSTSLKMQCDLSSPSRTTNNGGSSEDPMIISDSE